MCFMFLAWMLPHLPKYVYVRLYISILSWSDTTYKPLDHV